MQASDRCDRVQRHVLSRRSHSGSWPPAGQLATSRRQKPAIAVTSSPAALLQSHTISAAWAFLTNGVGTQVKGERRCAHSGRSNIPPNIPTRNVYARSAQPASTREPREKGRREADGDGERRCMGDDHRGVVTERLGVPAHRDRASPQRVEADGQQHQRSGAGHEQRGAEPASARHRVGQRELGPAGGLLRLRPAVMVIAYRGTAQHRAAYKIMMPRKVVLRADGSVPNTC